MRFLLSRRWLLFAVIVALLAWGASLLGQWQFHRLDERRTDNRIVARNLAAPPVPIGEVMSTTRATTEGDEWRRVTVHGTWDDEHTVVLKYQTREGASGVDVVTPLVMADGTAVLVDRGWMATENSGGVRPDVPGAGDGSVTVTGYVRANGTGSATKVTDLETRAISSLALEEPVGHDLVVGFLDLDKQSPPPATELETIELPDDTSEGPHFFYGLQWWFFGALAIFGFFYLMYDEWRRARRGETAAPDSQGAQHPTVDRKHDAGQE